MSNEDPDGFAELAHTTVAIIGLGLMGGSLALALRGKCARLLGIDRDPATLALAEQMQLVDQVSSQAAELLPQASLVILATPVNAILALLKELPAWHSGSAVVLDLGSTKRLIVRAMADLPARFDPLGGHPMCGREKSGLANARSDLYRNAPFVLTPLARTSPGARRLGAALAVAVGAHPLWLDPETHDRWAAAASHLPYLLASALMLATPSEAASLLGPGFRSTSRVAASDPGVMLDILQTNADEILAALGRLSPQLALLEAALRRGDWDALRLQLEAASRLRQGID